MSNDSQLPNPELQNKDLQEPTVLDLYKSVTKDWASFFNFIRSLWDARRRDELNRSLAADAAYAIEESKPEEPARAAYFPWRSVLALFFALAGQFSLESMHDQPNLGVALYIFAVGFVIWAAVKDEWHLPALPAFMQMPEPLTTRTAAFIVSIVIALMAFFSFGGGKFDIINITLWVSSLGFLVYSLWLKNPKITTGSNTDERRRKLIRSVIMVGVFAVAVFFRLYRTDSIPVEPFSDHAEKILDVYEITQGDYKIFFPRNTGREALQMYWTVLVANLFGTGLSYLSLKLGTALLGILTLPYIYLLGKEFGNERVGLFALFLFGIAYWPNVISRIGLRFPLISALRRADASLPDPRPADPQPKRFHLLRHFPRAWPARIQSVPHCADPGSGRLYHLFFTWPVKRKSGTGGHVAGDHCHHFGLCLPAPPALLDRVSGVFWRKSDFPFNRHLSSDRA